MNVRVLLFARARELVGLPQLEVELPAASTVSELRKRLVEQYPALAGFLDRCAIAVDDEYAEDGLSLHHGAQIGVLPPVSGG